MEPDMHYYDVIHLQIFHALHAVLLQCHAALSQCHADWVREVKGGGWGEPGKCTQSSAVLTYGSWPNICQAGKHLVHNLANL